MHRIDQLLGRNRSAESQRESQPGAADLIEYAHLVVVPIMLGRGERLWEGMEGLDERYDVESVASPNGVVHIVLTRH